MAGEWIKMRTNLWDDPRIAQLVELTESSEAAVVGAMYWLWATADEHTSDGFMPGMSAFSIDRKTGLKGFANAMITVGWLSANADGVTILRFLEHNGTSAKTRAQNAKRQAEFKAKGGASQNPPEWMDEGNAPTVTDSLPSHQQSVSGALPREEKRREDLKTTPIPPDGGSPQEKRKSAISLSTFLSDCKKSGVKPIPDDDPVFSYAEKVQLPAEFLALQWREFKDRYQQPDAKRYKAWSTVFLK